MCLQGRHFKIYYVIVECGIETRHIKNEITDSNIVYKEGTNIKHIGHLLDKPYAVGDGFDILLNPDADGSLCRYNLGVVEEVQPNGGGHARGQTEDKHHTYGYHGLDVDSLRVELHHS